MSLDAVVVGAGPNGLAAAIVLARAGRSVVVLEANETVGGAVRTAELTQPGFRHDLGSAIHPMTIASPLFRTLDLERHGLEWVNPDLAVAHPLANGGAALVYRDFERTVDALGPDGRAYERFYRYWVENFDDLLDLVLGRTVRIPPKPLFAARFGPLAALPATMLGRMVWSTERGRAIFAGHAAHSVLRLSAPFTSAFGILLGASAHAVGWPFPRGGAQSITNALVAELESLGGRVETNHPIESAADLPIAAATILAIGPHQVDRIVGDRFDAGFRRKLKGFRYGPGAFKLDFALSEPIPWANPEVARAGTVHLGGTLDEIAEAERAVARGNVAEEPFVLLAQHTMHDQSRAPEGKHTAWAYCHVPNGSTVDQTDAIESQIERFAPGFRDVVLARHVSGPADLERQNRSLVGGDLGGGSVAGKQLFLRPTSGRAPWDTPDPTIFMGSASTAPGGAVHGMGGYHAAQRALATVLR